MKAIQNTGGTFTGTLVNAREVAVNMALWVHHSSPNFAWRLRQTSHEGFAKVRMKARMALAVWPNCWIHIAAYCMKQSAPGMAEQTSPVDDMCLDNHTWGSWNRVSKGELWLLWQSYPWNMPGVHCHPFCPAVEQAAKEITVSTELPPTELLQNNSVQATVGK